MSQARRAEQPAQKQWKQQYRILGRKVDENQKAYCKLLSSFAELNPEHAQRANLILNQAYSEEKKLNAETGAVFGKLKKINEAVDDLRETLKYFDKTHESLAKVQKLSQGLFDKIQYFKNEMAANYDETDDIERKLSSDLELLERRIEGFDSQQEDYYLPSKKNVNKQNSAMQNKLTSAKSVQKLQKKQPSTKMEFIEQNIKQKQQQVSAVDQQIKELGKNLGWNQEDHKDFVTLWNRNQHKKYFQIQDEMNQYFKLYTNEQIVDHMNKYLKHLNLNERKKHLIRQYKELKEQKKQQEIIQLKSKETQRQMEQKRVQQQLKMEKQQKEMKEKVEHWKRVKEMEKNQEKRRQQEQIELNKQKQRQRRELQEQRRKEILNSWKQQQEKKEEPIEKQKPRRPSSAMNKQTVERIRQRQEHLIKQRTEKLIQKKIEQQEQQKKQQRLKEQKMVKYAYVKSKLEQKTTAIKEKEREKFDGKDKKDANTFGGQLILAGVRATPSWMQGL